MAITEKKKFWDTNFWKIAKPILIQIATVFVKKQKFIKTEQDKKNVDDGADVLRKM